MTNRHQRRATKAVERALPQIPNASGDGRCCGNCLFSQPRELMDEIFDGMLANYIARAKVQKVAPGEGPPTPQPDDETVCQKSPDIRGRKVWGFCHQWHVRESATPLDLEGVGMAE